MLQRYTDVFYVQIATKIIFFQLYTVGWGTKAQCFSPSYLKTLFFYVVFNAELNGTIRILCFRWAIIDLPWAVAQHWKLHRKIRFLNTADKNIELLSLILQWCVISWLLFHLLIWKNYVLYNEILTQKVELWIFFYSFHSWKITKKQLLL